MSLVGPRPLPLRDHALLEDWHRKRSNVLPGMTGLWQISGRSDLSFDDLVRLDFYYLENWSIWLDISILAKTLPAVIASRGAYWCPVLSFDRSSRSCLRLRRRELRAAAGRRYPAASSSGSPTVSSSGPGRRSWTSGLEPGS